MLHPSYKEMINKINETADAEDKEITSRYSLVIAAAKRARQINSGSEPLVPAKMKEKNLSVAVEELFAGKVHILDEEAVSEDIPEDETVEALPEDGETAEDITDETDEFTEEAAEEMTEEIPAEETADDASEEDVPDEEDSLPEEDEDQ